MEDTNKYPSKEVIEVIGALNVAQQRFVLSVYQITSELGFVDFVTHGAIFDMYTMQPKFQLITKCPIRCCVQAKNLFVVALENARIIIYDMDDDFKLVQTIMD